MPTCEWSRRETSLPLAASRFGRREGTEIGTRIVAYRCPALCSAGSGKDGPFWWKSSQTDSGMKTGITLRSAPSPLRLRVRAGTAWRSSGLPAPLPASKRSGPVRKSNQDVPTESSPRLRCAIYTRKSTEEGLEQEFNSLDAQREAAEAFIQSQRREGWIALPQL